MFSLPKPVYFLALATALLMSGTPLAILIGGLVGTELAQNTSLATLPLALVVLGVAIAVMPASYLLNKYGYKILFLVGTGCCLLANSLCITALVQQSFYLWLTAMLFIGCAGACAQQMRFAATAFVVHPTTQAPLALSVFMLGGVVAAIIGPELAINNNFSQLPTYASGFVWASALQIAAAIAVLTLPTTKNGRVAHTKTNTQITPAFLGLLAIVASVSAYGIMSFVMTATPISMHEHHGHSLAQTKSVIQWHILAMFLPSLFTGKIVQVIGAKRTMAAGLVTFLSVSIITLQGYGFTDYAIGLILLGIGWNLLFTAGSTLAAAHTSPNFKGKHDLWVFSVQAVASLGAGVALNQLGWVGLQWLSIAALLPLSILLITPHPKKSQ